MNLRIRAAAIRGTILCCVALAVATPLRAQHAATQPAAVQTPGHFRPMEYLVGSCWTGTFPDGKQTDEHCFEWVFDRKFIRDRHIVRNGPPYEGETMYGRQGSDAHVSYWYWNSAGGISTGRVDMQGDTLTFPERHVTADGVVEMRAVWLRTGPDRYRVVQEVRKGGEWTRAWTMEMVRGRAR